MGDEKVVNISDIQLDALKEVANIGGGNASIALSNIFKRRVNISLPDLNMMALRDAAKTVGGPKEMVVGIYSKIREGIEGNIILIMPINTAMEITATFMPDSIFSDNLRDEDKELLKKFGTATYISYLTSLAKFFKTKITFDKPNVVSSFGEDIFDFMMANLDESQEVVIIKIGFDIENTSVKGDFLLLFTTDSLKPLLEGFDTVGTSTVVENTLEQKT